MRLHHVLRGLLGSGLTPQLSGPAPETVEITGITYDSRQVNPGMIFVAVPGRKQDGHEHIPLALDHGAVAIVGTRPSDALDIPATIVYVRVADARRALGLLASELADHPSRQMGIIGVTGTDGKTTTTNIIAAILDAAGHKSGLTSTVDFKIGAERIVNETRFTNLEAPELQQLLVRMRDASVDYAVLETTSSGLELERMAGIEYDVAVVTNITSEHLEVHGTKARYWRAKAMLFDRIDPHQTKIPGPPFIVPRACILNADDASYAFLARFCHAPIISYGIENPGADVQASELDLRATGSAFTVTLPDGQHFRVETASMARFNVANCLAAIAATYSQGVPIAAMVAALGAFQGVPGRMERIVAGQDFAVIVDYAHTAESLRQVLTVLRPLTSGRLIAVFGSAGDRDKTKRPEMGAVGAELADYCVITDEDPRTEDAATILREIARGAEQVGAVEESDFVCQVGRRVGIARAFAAAQPGDTVVLCGKGHEQSIVIGTEKVPWDDRTVARELLAELAQG